MTKDTEITLSTRLGEMMAIIAVMTELEKSIAAAKRHGTYAFAIDSYETAHRKLCWSLTDISHKLYTDNVVLGKGRQPIAIADNNL